MSTSNTSSTAICNWYRIGVPFQLTLELVTNLWPLKGRHMFFSQKYVVHDETRWPNNDQILEQISAQLPATAIGDQLVTYYKLHCMTTYALRWASTVTQCRRLTSPGAHFPSWLKICPCGVLGPGSAIDCLAIIHATTVSWRECNS